MILQSSPLRRRFLHPETLTTAKLSRPSFPKTMRSSNRWRSAVWGNHPNNVITMFVVSLSLIVSVNFERRQDWVATVIYKIVMPALHSVERGATLLDLSPGGIWGSRYDYKFLVADKQTAPGGRNAVPNFNFITAFRCLQKHEICLFGFSHWGSKMCWLVYFVNKSVLTHILWSGTQSSPPVKLTSWTCRVSEGTHQLLIEFLTSDLTNDHLDINV